MSDFLLELSENPQARKLIKTLGLPIPVPESLPRAQGPYEERPFEGKKLVVRATPALADVLAKALGRGGASSYVVGGAAALKPFEKHGEAWGRPPEALDPSSASEGPSFDGAVIDATDVSSPSELRVLYDVLHPVMRRFGKNGRFVVLGRPPETTDDPAAGAARAGLEGFVRSLGKETGGSGSTANMVFVEEGAEDRVAAVLRFLLSRRSAFISGQPIRVSTLVKGEDDPVTRPLEGKVALVTGAARGIGEATAELLAAEGAHVVVLDRPADDGPASIVARNVNGSLLLVDITDADAPETIAKTLLERHGGVDIVVHNAGVTRDKRLQNMKPELWDGAVDINLGAVVRITDALLAKKALRDGGRVICLSSVSGIAGNNGQTNYSASKAGIVGFVKTLAPKVAKKGITVNAIAPGFIETRLTAAMPVMIREGARRLSSLGQGGRPDDVGQAITFLATPGAVGVTGGVLRVCGGALVGA
jgi:3-oxoacyl-[acyl-carrier protein] reductase